MKTFFLSLLLLSCIAAHAQFAPQAGISGSTAISAGEPVFSGWATHCSIVRGYQNIASPSLGYASLGDSSLGIGPANGDVVSLGDSGVAVLTFGAPIYNGPGADFAVFENGFKNAADPSQAFLELAFVEVSSDGINYFRFPAASFTQVHTQVANNDYIDASAINNLAGKYIANYGTPFDLADLGGTPGLDINNITHVRLVDVVGSIGAHAQLDTAGRPINDPYPTPFSSSGFDLDAVGAIHQVATGIHDAQRHVALSVYPNPATDNVVIAVKGAPAAGIPAVLTSITGTTIRSFTILPGENALSTAQYPVGMYYLVLYDDNGQKWVEKIIKQ